MLRRAVFTALLVLSTSEAVRASDETLLVFQLRSMHQSGVGAAFETIQSNLERFRAETLSQRFEVSAANVESLGGHWGPFAESYQARDGCSLRPYFSKYMLGYFELSSPGWRAAAGDITARERCYIGGNSHSALTVEIVKNRGRELGLTDLDNYRPVSASKTYQDVRIIYEVAIPASQLGDLRVDQKISFSCKVVGYAGQVSESWYQRRNQVQCVTDNVKPESKTLRCAKGHEYGPASGYRFCPVDGLPVQ